MPADSDSRTEPATPRRREEARKKGQVARSQDLSAATLLCVAFVALNFLGPRMWQSMLDMVRTGLASESPVNSDETLVLAAAVAVEAAKRLAPYLLIILVATAAVLLMQVGTLFSLQPLVPRLSKISPLNGFKRLFSSRMLMMAAANLGKLVVVALLIYMMFMQSTAPIIYAFTLEFRDAFRLGSSLAFELGMRLSVALLVLALLDLAWQRFRHEKDLRMTKEEVKDEFRSMEGDPRIKSRRRQLQYQLALQRIRKDVPQADVIVTNPTHVAVAIQYEARNMPAPKVIAKGGDQMALRIRQIAAEWGIPIVERRALARALFESVEIGQYIPERFYRAIAEILAYVYELSGGLADARRRDLASAP